LALDGVAWKWEVPSYSLQADWPTASRLSQTLTRKNCVRGNLRSMNQISVADILELPVQERIQLVEVIWESIAAFPHAIEVSPELKTELEARLFDFERNPEAGYSWDQVKAHLKSGSWRTA
jgi:putative addiction module component (TIGR02574 family)